VAAWIETLPVIKIKAPSDDAEDEQGDLFC